MSTFVFTGKKILITGVTRGFGKALAIALTEAGGSIYGVGRNQKSLDELAKETGKMVGICCDVTDYSKLEQLLKPHQPFDILINNAGVAKPEPFLNASEESYDQTLNVNLKAPFFITQMMAREMVGHKVEGVILNVSSVGSKMAVPHNHNYAASKAGLDHLSRCLAVELGPMGIRVNTINPGAIETDMIQEMMANFPKEYVAAISAKPFPTRTPPTMEDYIDTVMFLISDKAKKVTGTNFYISGGLDL